MPSTSGHRHSDSTRHPYTLCRNPKLLNRNEGLIHHNGRRNKSGDVSENEIGLKEDAIATEGRRPNPIPIEELIRHYKEDIMCEHYAVTVGIPKSHLQWDENGIIVRKSTLDGAPKKVIQT